MPSTFVGSLAQPAVTGNVATTGVGFQPKAILFYGNAMTADGLGAHGDIYFGMATSATNRACITNHGVDATGGNSDTDYLQVNDKCISVINSSGTVLATADLVSMDSDGFTLNWTTADATARIVNYMALGGPDLTHAFIKELQSPTSTGSVGYTGVGFQPDCVIAITGAVSDTPGTPGGSAKIGIGVATGASDERHAGFHAQNASTVIAGASLTNNRTIARLTNNNTFIISGDLTSMDADGFTINWGTVQVDGRYAWVLCLKGGRYKVGDDTFHVATTDNPETGVGFLPTGLFALATRNQIATTNDAISTLSIGAASSPANQSCVTWNHEDNSNADVMQYLDRANIVRLHQSNDEEVGVQALLSFDSDGFTMDTNDIFAASTDYIYLAFGSVGSGTGGSAVGRGRGNGQGGSKGGGTKGGNQGKGVFAWGSRRRRTR